MAHPLLLAVAAVVTVSLQAQAQAQTQAQTQTGARLNAIQAQIAALNGELRQVKRTLAARDAAIRGAQADASRARQQSQQTEAAVAHLAPPSGFGPMDAGTRGPTMGIGAAHPDYASPKTDFSSLSVVPITAGDQQAGATASKGTFHIGGLTIQLGGFFEGTAIYRSRNEVTDISSNFNTGIPLRQSPQYHEGEFRGSARQSRFAILMHGDIDPEQHVAGYAELDLQGAAGTTNSNESNSYNPRIRQAYLAYDNDAGGIHVLAGQAWSLATMNKLGVVPRQENLPLTIDQQYVPGFTWARQTQLRIAKDFNQKYWVAASLESPQTTYAIGPNGTGSNSGTANYNNPGISTLTPGQAYSTDIAPDVIVKFAADPGFGHYELFGIARFMQDRVSVLGNGHSNTRLAGGVGGGVTLPVIPKILDIEARGLAGFGIGRYGTSQLPDATISPTGAPAPLAAFHALVGVIGHPDPSVDLYSYVGTEQVARKAFNTGGKAYGYGNPLYSNAGCDVELSTASCTANTSGIVQGTLGAWWRFFQGDYGTVQAGVQYSYTRRSVFKGQTAAGGGGNAGTDENTALFSLRYLPFQ